MMPHIAAFVFARGGSKGVPRKNLRQLGGKPLIAHAIEAGLACNGVARVVVSTDDEEIAATARDWGAEVPFLRPAYLATDGASELDAWRHALQEYEQNYEVRPDVFLSIPPTAPLRAVGDVQRCIDRFQESPVDLVITVKPAERSPYFNMVREDDTGLAQLVNPPQSALARRQDCPAVYDMTTAAYVAHPNYVRRCTSLLAGRVAAVQMPAERAIDIDTELDFRIAEMIWNQNQLANNETSTTHRKAG